MACITQLPHCETEVGSSVNSVLQKATRLTLVSIIFIFAFSRDLMIHFASNALNNGITRFLLEGKFIQHDFPRLCGGKIDMSV